MPVLLIQIYSSCTFVHCSNVDNEVDAFVRPEHKEDGQDDAHASDEHHRNDDIVQQEEPICTSKPIIWNGNFFYVDVCEEHLGYEYRKLAHMQFGGGGTLQWISKDVPQTRMATGIHVTKKRCSFCNVGKCPLRFASFLHKD
jgi:hypothetical protein